MEKILSGTSAFYFHRIPPQVKFVIREQLDLSTRAGRHGLRQQGAFLNYLSTPIKLLVTDQAERHRCAGIRFQLCSHALPFGSVISIDAYHSVTSPAMTLLTMAREVSFVQLLKAIYEFCGTFSVFRVLPEHAEQIEAMSQTTLYDVGAWRQVEGIQGKLSDLWSRPPLTSIEEIRSVVQACPKVKGTAVLLKALDEVHGVVASPLEAIAALRLCAHRKIGGEGFGPVQLNAPIMLTGRARDLAGKKRCFADLLFETRRTHRLVAVECQGRMVHGQGGLTDGDANRLTALRAAGIEVLPVTYEQLRDPARFRGLVQLLAKRLDIRYWPKQELHLLKEQELVAGIFNDWWHVEVK